MTSLTRRLAAPIAAAVLTAGSIAAVQATAHGTTTEPGHDSPAAGAPKASFHATAQIEITRVVGGGPRGVAFLEQRGTRLTGWIAVWGLKPGTVHANHLHGPNAACRPAARRTTDHVANMPELKANKNGVAFRKINMQVTQTAVTKGVYWMIHKNPTSAAMPMPSSPTSPTNPPLACGDIVPLT
jgi:hypothetical protein